MNRCKDCKWWKRSQPYDGKYPEQRNCHIPEYELARQYIAKNGVAFHGECECPKFVYEGIPLVPDGLSYEDAEGYSASFSTGEDFGCVHWEAKEQCTHPLGYRVQQGPNWRCEKCKQVFAGDALEEVPA